MSDNLDPDQARHFARPDPVQTIYKGHKKMTKHSLIQWGTAAPPPPPPPSPTLKNHKSIGFLSNNGQDPLRITKLPNQHSMLGHHRPASETSGVTPWGRSWNAFMVRVFGSSLLSSAKTDNKTLARVFDPL